MRQLCNINVANIKHHFLINENHCKLKKCITRQETGIFTHRAMADQAREGLCYQKET